MMFRGSKFCPHCGARAQRLAQKDTDLPCPRCKDNALLEVSLAETKVFECADCHGLWVEASTFESICTDRERQSVVLGSASAAFTPGQRNLEKKIQYVRCPTCTQLMHRVNFAKYSGVIVDVCKAHGTWFDRDELQHIVEFIRGGGMDQARAKEKAELEQARRRLETARANQRGSWEPGAQAPARMLGQGDLIDIAGSFVGCFSTGE
jgi:Zn-finger nucleic acid-binding protein